MTVPSNFKSEKNRVMDELKSALDQQLIDVKIIPLLNLINSDPKFYTTSSCSGRILLIALARPGAKNKSTILGKWHTKLDKWLYDECINKWNEYPYLYFLAQSPILHINTYDLTAAIHLRNLGDAAGFKYSSLRSIKAPKQGSNITNTRITVELLSPERMNVPIGYNNKIYVDQEYLNFLLDLANDTIENADQKLQKLERILREKL